MKNTSLFSFITTITIITPIFTNCASENNVLYQSSFLRNTKQACAALIEKGFQEIRFKTPDNLLLRGLFLSRPHAICNVIVCAGWLPGRAENMAPFYDLLPENCNILLFESRGHGKSTGPLFSTIWRYGVDEYKDIVGTISYVHKTNNLPIILCGICSGAFNAAHALIFLQRNNLIEKLRIKGLIFDSGWGNVTTISRTVFAGSLEKHLTYAYKYFFNNQMINIQEIQKKSGYKALFVCINSLYKFIHTLLCKPLLSFYDEQTNLFNVMHHLAVPIFFIHSHDDSSAAITQANKLATYAPHKTCWWISAPSYHAKNHIIHRDMYKEKLQSFLLSIINVD